MEFVDLLLDNGEFVRIECPDKYYDELYESIDDAMKRGDFWSTTQFEGCSATYLGIILDRINMKRVVGM